MKKFTAVFTLIISVILALTFSACGNDGATTSDKEHSESRVLVVYFSWSPSGNTERIANYISEKTDATLWEIQPETPYPTVYNDCTEVAQQEKNDNARPAIKDPLSQEQIDGYDAVFIGYPIWWWTAPMIIGTFLESYSWQSETEIFPFSQSASMDRGQFNTSMQFVRDCAEGATVYDGLFARATNTSAIDDYLTSNGFTV